MTVSLLVFKIPILTMKQKLTDNTATSLQTVIDENHALLLFDGTCVSCDYVVNLILKNDTRRQFLFAPLQSSWGNLVLTSLDLNPNNLTTLILIHKQEVYTYSSAVFKVFKLLGPPLNGFLIFSFLPHSLTDFLYSLFANNRYQLFGHLKTCRLLSPEERQQFLKETTK